MKGNLKIYFLLAWLIEIFYVVTLRLLDTLVNILSDWVNWKCTFHAFSGWVFLYINGTWRSYAVELAFTLTYVKKRFSALHVYRFLHRFILDHLVNNPLAISKCKMLVYAGHYHTRLHCNLFLTGTIVLFIFDSLSICHLNGKWRTFMKNYFVWRLTWCWELIILYCSVACYATLSVAMSVRVSCLLHESVRNT